MTYINRISKLRDCGVFRDFEWLEELPEFGRYNLIYGWNGTGKTTLSRVFRDLEQRRQPTMGKVELRMDGSEVKGEQFSQSTLQIRVFNWDFIRDSVFPVGGGYVAPIFVFGKESVEKQKEAEELKEKQRTKEAELSEIRKKKEKAEKNLDTHCIDRARVIKDTLRSTTSNYNNYDKGDYKKAAENMMNENIDSYRLSESERGTLLAQHQAIQKPKVSEVAYRLPDINELADKVSELLRTTVVSAAIQALKDDSVLAEWTRQGLGLHKERKSDRCLFCEQPLPEDRLVKLEAHFNAEYELFLQRVEKQIRALESAEKQATELRLPNRAELYDDLQEDFDAACQAFELERDTVRNFMGELVKELNGKKAQPFMTSTLIASVPTVNAAVVDRLNEVIRKHNQACDDFAHRVRNARNRLAFNMIAERMEEFVKLRGEIQLTVENIKSIENEISLLKDQITQLERDIKEHRRPAEELNEDLKVYLGHAELQLAIKETGYAITRNDQPADMLSEGEMTAIALLYFLKSLDDRGFDKTNGVVVLDDPVSSLDANALYLAFGFIRERTKNAGQLIILTHNFSFFRHVRNWFHHLKGQNKKNLNQRPAQFYMLDCAQGQDRRCTIIRKLDPLLEKYESDYHYLFARVYRASTEERAASLEENYELPNMARRMLESFLAFRQPRAAGELWQKMQAVKFDEARKLRILRFCNTHSHSRDMGEPEHDLSLLAEGKGVLKDLMELMESEDKSHFLAMKSLVTQVDEPEEDHD